MNVDNGHLINLAKYGSAVVRIEKDGSMAIIPAAPVMDVGDEKVEDLESIPDELQGAAKRVLAGRPEAFVSLTSGGKLSRWAAQKRRERRRSKIANESRRRNRR